VRIGVILGELKTSREIIENAEKDISIFTEHGMDAMDRESMDDIRSELALVISKLDAVAGSL